MHIPRTIIYSYFFFPRFFYVKRKTKNSTSDLIQITLIGLSHSLIRSIQWRCAIRSVSFIPRYLATFLRARLCVCRVRCVFFFSLAALRISFRDFCVRVKPYFIFFIECYFFFSLFTVFCVCRKCRNYKFYSIVQLTVLPLCAQWHIRLSAARRCAV